MDIILYYIRDNLISVHYFIYAFVCLFLMFAIIGYLFKQKYAKLTINVSSSQPKKEVKENNTSQVNSNVTTNQVKTDTMDSQVTKNNQVNNQPTNVNISTNLTNLKPINQNSINNQVSNIPEVKPMPTNPNNQIRPTITPNNNSQVNPVNLNNQVK